MKLITFDFELGSFAYRLRPADSGPGVTIAFKLLQEDRPRNRWHYYLHPGTKTPSVYASIEEAVAHVRDVKGLRAEVKGGSNE